MSLLDALLPDPYRDKCEVWIALRSDGQRGSGTIADPYDGSTRLGIPLAATLTCNRREFIFGNGFPHGLSDDTVVTITGCEGLGKAWFNITALAKVVSPFHLSLLANNPNDTGLPPAPPDPRYTGLMKAAWSGKEQIVRLYWPVAKVTTNNSVPHGLPTFGAVDIGGISAPDETRFAGTYPAVGVPPVAGQSFYYRLGFLPNGDTSSLGCTVTPRSHRFDEAVRGVPEKSVLHLGPGIFETRGRSSVYFSTSPALATQLHVGCLLQTGQRWLGSGLGLSTLKFVLPVDDINQISAIGTFSEANYAEVADLTVDCNGSGHQAPFGIFPAPVTCGGVSLAGSFIALRRVRAIGFCTQGPAECFALFLAPAGTAPAIGNVIEDCIVEQPSENNTHETTLIANVGDRYGNGVSPVVRNNYVNCRYSANDANPNGVSTEPLWIESITYAGSDTEALVTTKHPHNRRAPSAAELLINPDLRFNNAVLSSVRQKVYNSSTPPVHTGEKDSVFNAAFPITAVPSPTQFKIPKPAGAPVSTDLVLLTPSDSARAALRVDFHGPSATSGTGCVTEGNAVYDCLNCYYSDTGSSRDNVVRDNYYSNIGQGVFMDFPPANFEGFLGASAIVPEAVNVTLGGIPTTGVKCGVFTTLQMHGFSGNPGDNQVVTIREAGEAQPRDNPNVSGFNPYHGTALLVVAKRSDYQFVYRLANQSAALPTNNCAGRPVFSAYIATSTFAFASSGPSAGEVTVVTTADHGLASGDFVTFAGVAPSSTPTNPPAGGSFSDYNGFWGPITPDPTDTKKFRFNIIDTVTNPELHPMKNSGTGGTMDRHVAAGVVRNGTVATVTTVAPHGYFLGQVFKMQGAWVDGTDNNPFNNISSVESVELRTFSFDLKPGNDPDPSKSPAGPVQFAAHWDMRHFVLENNVYDLYATDANTGLHPRAVSMHGLNLADSPPYLFANFVFRGNIVRHIDGQLAGGTAPPTYAIRANAIGNGIVEQNIIDTTADYPLHYYNQGSVTHLQNQTASGSLIRGFDSVINQKLPDLEARVADALTMSLL